MNFCRDNHYVPCLYLRRFSSSPTHIQTYRILVADSRVPLWKSASIKGVAYHAHLYTRMASRGQSDEIERWLNTDFETPAEEALRKATEDRQLSSEDWSNLIRFLAAQDVRTPTRLAESLARWRETLEPELDKALRDSIRSFELAKSSGHVIKTNQTGYGNDIPLRIITNVEPGQQFGTVKAEIIAGRSLWLFGMKYVLTKTVAVLLSHRWSILTAPPGLSWFTSDDPVIRLNYHDKDKYDFKGGWGSPGTEIFLPLSPRHLLYTKVGERPPCRGATVPNAEAQVIRRFIAEHAHRFIFAASSEPEMARLRPRIASLDLLRDEDEQWRRWHEDQTNLEREFINSRKRPN